MRCLLCSDVVHKRRWALGFKLCLPCGEQQAKQVRHCIVPLNKSNYVVVSDRSVLRQLNPKRSMS